MSRAERLLFSFLRLGLYGDTRENIVWAEADDWDELFSLSCRQAVFGIVADGIAMTAMRPPLALWQKWIALLLHTEMMNEEMACQGDHLVGMLAADGIKTSVFKGTSVARWYPKPAHRSYGDIDIVVHEGWERLAPLLRRKAIPYYEEDKAIVTEHLGHARDAAQRFSSYDWQYRTEFHPVYEFIYNPLMNARLRQITAGTSAWWNARFGRSGRPYEVPEFYLACVILHLRRHVLSYGTGLKQVCDVAVMVKYADVDLAKLRAILQHLGAWRFGKALLDFVKTYIDLERRSLGDNFFPVIQIAPDVHPSLVFLPSMLIQIPVENAVKHALRGKEGERRLWIDICRRDSGEVSIQITDNGGGYRPNSLHRGTGTGMKVVMQTIQILNAKNKQALDVEVHNVVLPSGETGCQVSFLLPVKYDYRL